MHVRQAAIALAVAFTPSVAFAQQQDTGSSAGAQDDCAFLERSFEEVYNGLRETGRQAQAGQSQGEAQGQGGPGMAQVATQNPELVTMFVGIQRNIILMHQARGCAASDLIAIARQEAEKYTEN